MQLSIWHEIGLIWMKDTKSCWTLLHQRHVPIEITWQQRSDQRDNCKSRSRVLCVGIWLYLVAAIQQTLLSMCFRVKRGENTTGYCHGTSQWAKNTSLINTAGELGSGILRDARLTEKAADAFSMPGRRQECCFGKWWAMAKAAKEIRMCEGKTEHREA